MKTIEMNDKLHSRNLHHKNILAVSAGPMFMEFVGETIPGICRVHKSDYCKNGKWSHSTWTVELADGVMFATFVQDWEARKYFPAETWDKGIADFVGLFPEFDVGHWKEAAERFIRATFPKNAARFDAERTRTENPAPIQELIKAQEAMAAAQAETAKVKMYLEELIKARELEEQAIVLERKNAALKEKLKDKKRLSLEELQNLYNSL